MINWYKSYDEEKKDQPFKLISYTKYTPYAEDCIFTVHYFEEIKHNFFKFEQGRIELLLNNDHFCSRCQAQLLKQSLTLCTTFKTESLLCEIPILHEFALKAVQFFEAERFYYFSFWNAVINDKQFLLARLKYSYARFYRFLVELNACLLPIINDSKFESGTYKELQAFLVNTYKALILEIEHFDYLYPEFVKIIKINCEICSKLMDSIQMVISKYDAKEEVVKRKPSEAVAPEEKISKEAVDEQADITDDRGLEITEEDEESEEEAVIDKMIDIGIVKKNLRKVFHEKKLQRYQKQKQKLDQQLLNKGRREMSSLKQYFTDNLERQKSNLYYYKDLLAKHHLNNVEIKGKFHGQLIQSTETPEMQAATTSKLGIAGKTKTIFDNKEYKESPNNPNYRYERIMRMMEEKKRKNLDEYITSLSNEYLQTVKDSWINFVEPAQESASPQTKSKTKERSSGPTEISKAASKAVRTFLSFLTPETESTRPNDTTPMHAISPIDKRKSTENHGDSEVSDESVFTDEEKAHEKDKSKPSLARLGMEILKKVKMESAAKPKDETPKGDAEGGANFWFDGDEDKKKKRDQRETSKQVKVDDWITHFSFNELIRQKKFDVIPKRLGMRTTVDKKPNKYRAQGMKANADKEGAGELFV